MEKLLVPLDGSATAEAVLPHLKRLIRRDMEVVLVRAVPVPVSRRTMPPLRPDDKEPKAYLAQAKAVVEDFGCPVRALVVVGDPADAILEAATAEDASMILMATHGATGLKRVLFGSVAEMVLRRAAVPVLVVHPFRVGGLLKPLKVSASPIRRILVPVDGDSFAVAALPSVARFAERFDATVVLVHAMVPEKGAHLERLREISDTIEKDGIPVDFRFQEGDPVASILRIAEQEDVDLVVMATHGRRGLSRLLRGSVTEAVLRRSERPLLVVPAARKAAGRRLKERSVP